MQEKIIDFFINLVAEGVKRGMNNNAQSADGKDPYELLTIEQVCEEFHVGLTKARRMFKDPEFQAQRYMSPHRVARIAVQKYMTVKRDYLCGKE